MIKYCDLSNGIRNLLTMKTVKIDNKRKVYVRLIFVLVMMIFTYLYILSEFWFRQKNYCLLTILIIILIIQKMYLLKIKYFTFGQYGNIITIHYYSPIYDISLRKKIKFPLEKLKSYRITKKRFCCSKIIFTIASKSGKNIDIGYKLQGLGKKEISKITDYLDVNSL